MSEYDAEPAPTPDPRLEGSVWEKYEARSRPGKFYFYNTQTGATRWKFPTDLGHGGIAPVPPKRPAAMMAQKCTFGASVKLNVIRCRKLNFKNQAKTCYCTVVGQRQVEGGAYENVGDVLRTQCTKGSVEPGFNQSFEWKGVGDEIDRLFVNCFKREPLRRDKPLGCLHIAVAAVKNEAGQKVRRKEEWVCPSQGTTVTGSLEYEVTYIPGGELIIGTTPGNVKRVGHVGLTEDGLLDLQSMPPSWVTMFKTAGITKRQVKDNNRAVVKVLAHFGYIPKSMVAPDPSKDAPIVEEAVPSLFARVLYDHIAEEPTELTLKKGDIVELLEDKANGFWNASFNSQEGFVQGDYLEVLFAMLPGWVEVPDEDGGVCYKEIATGTLTWERPVDPEKISPFTTTVVSANVQPEAVVDTQMSSVVDRMQELSPSTPVESVSSPLSTAILSRGPPAAPRAPPPLPSATSGSQAPPPLPSATGGPRAPRPLPSATNGPRSPPPLPAATSVPRLPPPLPAVTSVPRAPPPLPSAAGSASTTGPAGTGGFLSEIQGFGKGALKRVKVNASPKKTMSGGGGFLADIKGFKKGALKKATERKLSDVKVEESVGGDIFSALQGAMKNVRNSIGADSDSDEDGDDDDW